MLRVLNYRKMLLPACVLCLAMSTPAGAAVIGTVVHFDTVIGGFDVGLYDDATPLTVANFLSYVTAGDYDSTFFHRLAPDFVLQGGGFTITSDVGGEVTSDSIATITAQAPVANEFGVSNTRGTIAMAKLSGNPDSATDQFFFNLTDNSANLDSQNGGFTVFGEVMNDGMTIVDLLATFDFWKGDVALDNTALGSLPLLNYQVGQTLIRENFEMINSITVLVAEQAQLPTVLAGDFNSDGVVDIADYTTWADHFGWTGAPAAARWRATRMAW